MKLFDFLEGNYLPLIGGATTKYCCLQFCGSHSKFKNVFPKKYLNDCKKSIVGYRRSCSLRGKFVDSKAELIAMRVGTRGYNENTDRGITICPYYRFSYGLCWKSQQKCGFPGYRTESKCKLQRGTTSRICKLAQLG